VFTPFLAALIAAGFVDQTEAGPVLHNWSVYAGRYLRGREQRRQAALTRWHGRETEPDATVMRPHSEPNGTAMHRTEQESRGERDKPSEGESEGES
jgi:hypothetical protein